MNRSRLIFISIVILAFVAAGLVYLIPTSGFAKYNIGPLAVHTRAAIGVLGGVLSTGSAIWVLTGSPRFQPAFRTAYGVLTAGIAIFSLSLLQLPVFAMFQWWDTWYVNSGVMIVPFLVAIAMIYGGLWKFSRILEIRSKAASWLVVAAVAITFSVATGLVIGHIALYPRDGIEYYTGAVAWGLAWLVFCASIAWYVWQAIGESYKDAMRWMLIAIVGYTLATAHEYLINYIFWDNGAYFWWGLQLVPWVIAGALYLEAGRHFYLLTSPVIARSKTTKLADHDYVDSVIRTTHLSSRPQDIDPMLDDLRQITARHDEATLELSEQERKRLLAVYQRLEEYLLTKEPVRRFTKEEIRSHIHPGFQALLS